MLPQRIVSLIVLCLVCLVAVSSSGAPVKFDPRHFQARGLFELVIKDAKPLTPGASRIRSRSAFASRVHGLIPGNNTIRFYDQLQPTLESQVRLFMVPGMDHCSGGEGASQFDTLGFLASSMPSSVTVTTCRPSH